MNGRSKAILLAIGLAWMGWVSATLIELKSCAFTRKEADQMFQRIEDKLDFVSESVSALKAKK